MKITLPILASASYDERLAFGRRLKTLGILSVRYHEQGEFKYIWDQYWTGRGEVSVVTLNSGKKDVTGENLVRFLKDEYLMVDDGKFGKIRKSGALCQDSSDPESMFFNFRLLEATL